MNLFKNLEIVLICDSISVWNLNLHLKQSCREFCGEKFFFLLQPLKKFAKASKMVFKLFGKKNSKKWRRERGALAGRGLAFGPLAEAGPARPRVTPLPAPALAPRPRARDTVARRQRSAAVWRGCGDLDAPWSTTVDVW